VIKVGEVQHTLRATQGNQDITSARLCFHPLAGHVPMRSILDRDMRARAQLIPKIDIGLRDLVFRLVMLNRDRERSGHIGRAQREVFIQAVPNDPVETDRKIVRLPKGLGVDRHNEVGTPLDQGFDQRSNQLPSPLHVFGAGDRRIGNDAAGDMHPATAQRGLGHQRSSITGEALRLFAACSRWSNVKAWSG
jgi:hypothetical protein